jgi:catalase
VVTPAEMIDGLNSVFGLHRGRRTLHAKGTFCRGTFTPTEEAGRLSRAIHMQGPVQVTARLSNGSGDPASPDYSADVRGLAVTFHLPGEGRTDIVAQTSPRFPVRTPDDFLALTRAVQPGAGLLWRFPAFLARHPGTVTTLAAGVNAAKPPPTYAVCSFYAIHAYRWVDSDGGSRYVRYSWRPEASEPGISAGEAKKRGRDYLQEDLRRRLDAGTVSFRLELQVAAPGDSVDDPSSVWPEERRRLTAGTLELSDVLEGTEEAEAAAMVYDPARVTDGVELSDDPILRYRPRAYSVSHERRTAA